MLVILIIFLLFIPKITFPADLSLIQIVGLYSQKNAQNKGYKVKSNQLKQVAAFKLKKNAERFAKKLKNEGFKVVIRKEVIKHKGTIYKVFIKKPKEPSKGVLSSGGVKQDTNSEALSIKDNPVGRKGGSGESQKISKDTLSSSEVKQIATFKIFKIKEKAEKFAKELRNKGFEVVIHKDITKDEKTIYTVFAEKTRESSGIALSSSEVKQGTPLETEPVEEPAIQERLSGEPKKPSGIALSSTEVRQKTPLAPPSVEDKPVIQERLSDEPKEPSKSSLSSGEIEQKNNLGKTSGEDKSIDKERPLLKEGEPIGRGKVTADIFGRRGGYLHPFLSVIEYYSDNVFNSKDAKNSDFVTVISPGIWMTFPHVYEKLLSIDTSTLAPGGISLSRPNPEYFRRYQTYLFYNADIERFSKYTSGNTIDHKLEGLFQYNLRGGLSMELVDQFLASHDIWGTGTSTELDKFKSNLSNVILTYPISEKFKFRIDYSNFFVHYDASRNNFRDRDDNAFSGYIFYKFKPKTSVFVEYQFIDIKYNEGILSDSQEHHYFGGLQWDITAKSKGSIKTGYGIKDFSMSALQSSKDFILEAQIDHKFTPKTSLMLKASRKTNETNISATDFILTNSVEAKYVQKLTGKITGKLDFSYTNDTYKGALTFGGETKEIKDNYFTGAFALQYKFKEWLEMSMGYIHNMRDSNFSEFGYSSNIVFIRLTGSL
jgi:hypothetical protein